MHPIPVGLIGYGFSGATFHAPVLAATAELELVAVVTGQPGRVAARWPGVRTYAGVADLLADPAVELVVITSPNAEHHPQAKAALEAGKHVVVEKPFTITSAQAGELERLAAARGRVLSAYHNRRWDNDFLTVRKVLDSGLLGEVHSYEARFDRFRPEVRDRWRERDVPGGGILYDLGPHLIDQALLLFGPPATVAADLRRQRPGARAVDSFRLLLGYPGRRVLLSAGMLVKAPGPRFELHGSLGSFVKHGLDPQEDALKAGGRPGDPGWGEDPPQRYGLLSAEVRGLAVSGPIPTEPGDYRDFYRGVARAIRGDGPPPVSAAQARAVIRVIELAEQSHREGRRLEWPADRGRTDPA